MVTKSSLFIFFFLGFFLISSDSNALTEKKYSFTASFDAELAEHINPPSDPASQKLGIAFEQKATLSNSLKGVFGFSSWNEAVYITQTPPSAAPLLNGDAQDLRLRNVYLQYQSGSLFLRLGNQQVVWGESYGFFYSDIVNPKDERYGLFGDFSDIRLQTPMLNAKLVFSNLSLQALYIPQPFFNLLPSPGNDFAFPLKRLISAQSYEIDRQGPPPVTQGNEEFGSRMSFLLDRLDISAFFFSYFDRNPWYNLSARSQIPQSLILDEQHSRIRSYGLSLTDDMNGTILRLEGMVTPDRFIPSLSSIANLPALGATKLDNYIYVVGFDLPTWRRINLSLQWSQDILIGNTLGLLRNDIESLATAHLQYSLFRDNTATLLYSFSTEDSGQRLQFNYALPLSNGVEAHFGADYLGGPPSSNFGGLNQATRYYLLLKCFIKG